MCRDGLAGVRAERAAGGNGVDDPSGAGTATGLLGVGDPLPRPGFFLGARLSTADPSADRARFLLAHPARGAEPDRSLVDGMDRSWTRLHVRRTGRGIVVLQPAVRSAADGCVIRAARSGASGSIRRSGRLTV